MLAELPTIRVVNERQGGRQNLPTQDRYIIENGDELIEYYICHQNMVIAHDQGCPCRAEPVEVARW